MDNLFFLSVIQFIFLASVTVILPILQGCLTVLFIILEIPSNPETTSGHTTFFSKNKKILLGLSIIFSVSILGGLLAAKFPGHLIILGFYIVLALTGTIKNYVNLIFLLDIGWYIELGAINKLLSNQLTNWFYFSTFLNFISGLIIIFIGFFLCLNIFLPNQISHFTNSKNEVVATKPLLVKYLKYLAVFILTILSIGNVFAVINIAKALEVSVFAIVTLYLHSLLGEVLLIGKKITLKQLTNSSQKVAVFILPISMTAIGLLLGWSLGGKPFISH